MGPGIPDFDNSLDRFVIPERPAPPEWDNILGKDKPVAPDRKPPESVGMPERVVPRGGGSYPG